MGGALYFNLHQHIFYNWKWTPAESIPEHGQVDGFYNWKWTPAESPSIGKLMGTKEEDTLTFAKICDLNAGSISPRLFCLTGPAQETEANFWRAFAYSEFMAVPMYREVGKLIDEVKKIKYDW
jgi:hypothetical protein